MHSHRCSPVRALVSILLLGGPPAGAETLYDPMLRIETYATGFTSPTFFEFLPGASGSPVEMLVTQGLGRVLHYRDGTYVGDAIDLPVAYLFERGMFGIALHPDFASHPWVYLYYTASRTGVDTSDPNGALDNRVVRLTWDGSSLTNEQLLLSLPVGFSHNGGALVFGPDGMLYGSIGEAGSTTGQMQNVATGAPPNDTSMIFRLRDDGTIPEDNPFYALGGAVQKVYAYGIRNVFGLDFDPRSNVLWNTDNGPTTYDEVNRVPPGTNGGWKQVLGPSERNPAGLANLWVAPGSTYVDPKFSFYTSFGITAIHFQRGPGLGENYDGDLFVAAHNSQAVYHFEPSPDRTSLVMPDTALADLVSDNDAERDLVLWASGVGVILDMETGPDGALYLLRFSGTAQIYRVSRRRTSDVGPDPTRLRLVPSPDPFRTRTLLRVLGGGLDPAARLRIYSPAGRLVRVLALHAESVEWDGRDARGRQLPAGVYLVRLHDGRAAPPQQAKLVRVP